MTRIPKRLERDPIVDCVVEMRFKPASDSVAEVLPGLLYNSFKDSYPDIVGTPESELPKHVRAIDTNLRTRPTTLLKGPLGHLGVGDEIVQLSFMRPYIGWNAVRPKAEQMISSTLDTGLVSEIKRLSILYTNIVGTVDDPHDLSPFTVKLSTGDELVRRPSGTSIRFEVEGDKSISVVQIQTGATADIRSASSNEPLSGLFLRIDTISVNPISDLNSAIETLDRIHKNEKKVFFGLLTEPTLNALEAIWE